MAIRMKQALLFVKDVSVMKAFYADLLGLAVVTKDSSPDFTVLDAGGTRLALHAIPKGRAKDVAIETTPRARDLAVTKLVFAVDDVLAERERLVAAGVSMREPWSFGACDGVDPEGNVFQIAPA
jgi:predicted enzyme related to lactoylglutathione lyase